VKKITLFLLIVSISFATQRAVIVEDIDGNKGVVDPQHGAIVAIDPEHYEIHEGEGFQLNID